MLCACSAYIGLREASAVLSQNYRETIAQRDKWLGAFPEPGDAVPAQLLNVRRVYSELIKSWEQRNAESLQDFSAAELLQTGEIWRRFEIWRDLWKEGVLMEDACFGLEGWKYPGDEYSTDSEAGRQKDLEHAFSSAGWLVDSISVLQVDKVLEWQLINPDKHPGRGGILPPRNWHCNGYRIIWISGAGAIDEWLNRYKAGPACAVLEYFKLERVQAQSTGAWQERSAASVLNNQASPLIFPAEELKYRVEIRVTFWRIS